MRARNDETGEEWLLVDGEWQLVNANENDLPKPEFGGGARGSAAGALGENALSLATGAVAAPVAGLAGIASAVVPGMNSADIVESVKESLTYSPRTQAGQDMQAAIATPFQKYAEAADAVGDFALKHTGSPMLATIARTGVEGLPDLLGIKGASALRGVKVRPRPHANPEVQLLRDEGVNVTRGRAGSRVAESIDRGVDNVLGPSHYAGAVPEQFTTAVLRRAGLTGNKLDDAALKQLENEVGKAYEDLTGRVDTKFDQTLLDELGEIEKAALAEMKGEVGPVKGLVSDLLESANDGLISGKVAQSMRSRAGRLSNVTNPSQRHFMGEITEALDNAFERSASKADAAAMATVRDRRRTLGQLRDAMRGNASGYISPATLYNVLDKKTNRSATTLRDLARAGKNVLGKQVNDSGSPTRLADMAKIVHGVTSPVATVASLGGVNMLRRAVQDPTAFQMRPQTAAAGVAGAVSGSGEAMLAEQRARVDAYLRAIGAR